MEKNSPSCSSFSPFNAILTISIYSRSLVNGFLNTSPCKSSITSLPDAPNPKKNLPPDMLSRFIAAMAKLAGLRANTGTMLDPMRMFLVNADIWAKVVNASPPHASPTVMQSYLKSSASTANSRVSFQLPSRFKFAIPTFAIIFLLYCSKAMMHRFYFKLKRKISNIFLLTAV